MSLLDYFGKEVRIVETDGTVIEGTVDFHTPAIDNEEDEESIGIKMTDCYGIELFESEIELIEIA